MATVVIHHTVTTGAAADPNALVDGPAWDAAHTVTGLENVPNVDTTDAGNISTGTLPAAQLPTPTSTTLGGVKSLTSASNKWLNSIGTDGGPTQTQPAFSNISGNLAVSQLNSGTDAGATTFWCGDNTWKVPTVAPDVQSLTSSFGGRLTLVSGAPIMTLDVIGAQNIYYAPSTGKVVPILTSGTWGLHTFTSSSTDQVGLTLALAGSANWAADSIHDVFAIYDSGALKLATRLWDAGMYTTTAISTGGSVITTGTGATAWVRTSAAFDGNTAQATAAAALVSPSNNGMANFLGRDWGVGVQNVLTQVKLYTATDNYVLGSGAGTVNVQVDGSNDGATWVNLVASGTLYNSVLTNTATNQNYTIPVGSKDAFRFHRLGITGNGVNGIAINELQFTVEVAPANGRRLTEYDGILVNDASMTARTGAAATVTTAQYEGSYLGSIHIDTATAGQVTAHFTYGPSRTFGVWNNYNQKPIKLRAGIGTTLSYTVSSQSWVSARGDATNCLQVFQGIAGQSVSIRNKRTAFLNGVCALYAGVGIDIVTAHTGDQYTYNIDAAGQQIGNNGYATATLPPFAGLKKATAIEAVNSGAGTTSSWSTERDFVLEAYWLG